MRLRTSSNSELLDERDYDGFVHDLIQTEFQNYIDKHGVRPRTIYLTHFEALALTRHAFRLVNKPCPFLTLDSATFNGVPIKLESRNYIFEQWKVGRVGALHRFAKPSS